MLLAGQPEQLQMFDLGDAAVIDELAPRLVASIRGSGRDLKADHESGC